MEELLHELADAELGKQVMDTVGVAVTKCNTFIRQPKNKHNADWWETEKRKPFLFTRKVHVVCHNMSWCFAEKKYYVAGFTYC